MSQPSPPTVKSETQPTPPVKKAVPQTALAETKPAPTNANAKPESAPRVAVAPISTQIGKTEPVSTKMEKDITPGVKEPKTESKPIPTTETLPAALESQPLPLAKKEHIISSATPEKRQPEPVETKKEAEKNKISVKDVLIKEAAQLDQPKVAVAVSPFPATKATVAPISTVPSEVAEVVPVAQKKPSEVITLTEDTKSLQPVRCELRNTELVPAADNKAMVDKVTEITKVTVTTVRYF